MKTGNELSRWLVNVMAHRGYHTPTDRASVMGWTIGMQSQFESGSKFPDVDRLMLVINRLKLSQDDAHDAINMLKRAKAEHRACLRERAIDTPSAHTVIVWAHVTTKGPAISEETAKKAGVALVTKQESDRRVFAIEMDGDTMFGGQKPICDGDVVIVAPSEMLPPTDGDVCCIQIDGGEWVIRRVKDNGNGKVLIIHDNPAYEAIEFNIREHEIIVKGVVLRSITVHKKTLDFQTVPAKITGK